MRVSLKSGGQNFVEGRDILIGLRTGSAPYYKTSINKTAKFL
jgi:hypothetical protein